MARATPEQTEMRRAFVEEARQAAEREGRPFPRPFAFTRQSANPTHQSWKAATWHRLKKGT